MTKSVDPTDDHGRLTLDAESVSFTRGHETLWTVPLQRLRVIGECTNSDGPWLDDWFIVFIAANPFETLFAPVEAEGALLTQLSGRLGVLLSHGLANRTDLASRVLWPEQLRDRPLFDFQRIARSPGIWSRVKDVLIPLTSLEPTAEVRKHADA